MAKYVYLDNSNVWIEGMRVAAVEHKMAFDIADANNRNVFDYDWKYDFGKLLNLIAGAMNGLKRAVLFGSRPPQNDSLWNAARQCGYEVIVHDRNAQNNEKKIDTGIVTEFIGDSYERVKDKENDLLILISGDADYVPAVEHVTKRGVRVQVVFWDHASSELKRAATEFFSLNPYLEQLRR